MKKIILLLVFVLTSFVSEAQTVYSFEDAQKMALATNKLVILDFTASWCGPCKKMEADVWSNEEVKKIVDNFVFAKIDLDTNKSLAQVYGVQAIPNILLVDGNGKVLEQNVGYMNRGQVTNLFKPYQLNTEFLMNEAITFFKKKSYSTALRLALKNYDYSIYLDDSTIKRKFVGLAGEYLKEASSLNDKKSEKYKEINQILEVIELSEYAYLGNFDKLEKKLSKIDFNSLTSNYSKKQYQFYQYLLALNNNTQEDFLANNNLEGFDAHKGKAELIFEKFKS